MYRATGGWKEDKGRVGEVTPCTDAQKTKELFCTHHKLVEQTTLAVKDATFTAANIKSVSAQLSRS